jgi:hypothetical protein
MASIPVNQWAQSLAKATSETAWMSMTPAGAGTVASAARVSLTASSNASRRVTRPMAAHLCLESLQK